MMAASVAETQGSPTAALPDYWPTAAWRESSPEAQGMDSRELATRSDWMGSHDFHPAVVLGCPWR